MTTPADALRDIADHLDRHVTRHGRVTVVLAGAKTDDLAVILDGASDDDITIHNTAMQWPAVERDFGLARLVTHVPRGIIAESRTTVTDEVLTPAELVARHNQQRLEVGE